jgi:Mg2+/Co2+ transporter CorB
VVATPLMVHEAMPIFKVLEHFKKAPVRLAVVVDEYGGIEGIVTQADLLERWPAIFRRRRATMPTWSAGRTARC